MTLNESTSAALQVASMAPWAEAARELLALHRKRYAEREIRHNVNTWGKPFKAVELAFQMTILTGVALFVPEVHPLMLRFGQLFMSQEDCARELGVAPTLTLLISAISAKLIIDSASFWRWPILGWAEPRPPQHELLHPFSLRGLELNGAGAVAGVGLGCMAVSLRGMVVSSMASTASEILRRISGSLGPIVPTAIARPLAAVSNAVLNGCSRWLHVILHIVACATAAPVAERTLSATFRRAQARRQPMAVAAGTAAFGSLGLWRRLSPSCRRRLDDVPYWDVPVDGVQPPHDLLCPITGHLFVQPVELCGMVFEDSAARIWVETTSRHPVLQDLPCRLEDLAPAPDLAALCKQLATAHGWLLHWSGR